MIFFVYIIIIFGILRLAVIINCHEDSDYIKHKRAKNSISDIIVVSTKKDERYKWALRNRNYLKHIHKNHPEFSFRNFIKLAYKGKLYL